MANPRPIKLTQRAAIAGERAPEPLVVVGTIPGAGVAAATTANAGVVKRAATQADFAGADVAALKVELNAFLAKLKTAGIAS